jgi:DNA-binding PadR family transcriptional regulator
LVVLSEEPMYGLAIKRELEEYYGEEVNHGRLYPNLDDLVERGFVEKSELDKRTNQYELTDEGLGVVLDDLEWRLSKVDDESAEDLT